MNAKVSNAHPRALSSTNSPKWSLVRNRVDCHRPKLIHDTPSLYEDPYQDQ